MQGYRSRQVLLTTLFTAPQFFVHDAKGVAGGVAVAGSHHSGPHGRETGLS